MKYQLGLIKFMLKPISAEFGQANAKTCAKAKKQSIECTKMHNAWKEKSVQSPNSNLVHYIHICANKLRDGMNPSPSLAMG